MACQKDYDLELINQLKTVNKYNIIGGNVLVLNDKDGRQVAKCNKLVGGDEIVDINKIINQMKGITTGTTSTGGDTKSQGTNSVNGQQQNGNQQQQSQQPQKVNVDSSSSSSSSMTSSATGVSNTGMVSNSQQQQVTPTTTST